MSEASMWDAIRPVLKQGGLDPVRVENPVWPGTPDVNYTGGWVELKWCEQWPPRGGPLRIDHFTVQQRTWLTQRRLAGGRAFLLLKVGENEWLLFDGAVAAKVLGHVEQDKLYRACLARWTRKPKTEEICKWLT